MKAKRILSLIGLAPFIVRMAISLLAIWLTLGWKTRKAKKAFEKQLIKSGMPKHHVKRLSQQYVKLKNDIVNAVKQSVFTGKASSFLFPFNIQEDH